MNSFLPFLLPFLFLHQWSKGTMPSYCHRAGSAQFPQRWRAPGTQQGGPWMADVRSGWQPGSCSHHIHYSDRGQSGAPTLKLWSTGSDKEGCKMRHRKRVTVSLNIKAAAQDFRPIDSFCACDNINTHWHTVIICLLLWKRPLCFC